MAFKYVFSNGKENRNTQQIIFCCDIFPTIDSGVILIYNFLNEIEFVNHILKPSAIGDSI